MRVKQVNRWLILIIAGYLVLATAYSFVTPPFEASDELWHYPMVKALADNGLQLPVQQPGIDTAWRQEGSQPPLYYMLAAVLTSGIDTSDLEYWRRINPHADIGVMRPDANANMIVHRPDEGQHRFTGALLALQVSRFLSVLLGAGTVIVTFQLGRTLFPAQKEIALIAAAFNAFLPMFLFISGSVNNDNLSNLLGGLLTLLTVRLLQAEHAPRILEYVALGAACGAGILSKLNLGFFIPVIALALLIVSLRLRDWRPLIIGGIVSGALTIAIAGWWYLRNLQLYGDPTGLNIFLDIVGRRTIPASLPQLWSERDSFVWAFWGFFGGVNVPMASWVYTGFNILAGIAVMGAVLYCISRIAQSRHDKMQTVYSAFPHLLTLLWILVTFVSYLRWTSETPASQGRLMFGALSAICVWLALGWSWWLRGASRRIAALPVLYTLIVALWMPLGIDPPYVEAAQPAMRTTSLRLVPDTVTTPADFSAMVGIGRLRLLRAATQPSAQVESYLHLEMNWEVIERTERDWSLFIHLVTPDGVIIGQRDVYPARGLLATSDLPAGRAWYNPVAVWVPANAYAPMQIDVVAGWYHLPTGERMRMDDGSETILLGTAELLPRSSSLDVPNPTRVNFGAQIELVGYSLTELSPAAGSSITLTLYWRALRPLTSDYTVFAQILDKTTTTIYAGSDAQPAGWARPTTTWSTGEIVEDGHTLTLHPDAPPGIYDIHVGLYTRGEGGSFDRLRVITEDGGEAFDYTELTRVRVMPRVMP